MIKIAYVGEDGKARKAKKIYTGVDGKARRVKKMYVGVDGKARVCYSEFGTFERTDIVLDHDARMNIDNEKGATQSDNYAFTFTDNSTYSTSQRLRVIAYDSALTAHRLGGYKCQWRGRATSLNNKAIYGGGYNGSAFTNVTTAFDDNLTHISCSSLSAARMSAEACANDKYAFFIAGYSDLNNSSNVIDVFDTSLTRTNVFTAEESGYYCGVGFNGSIICTNQNYLECYDDSLVKMLHPDKHPSVGYSATMQALNDEYAILAYCANDGE